MLLFRMRLQVGGAIFSADGRQCRIPPCRCTLPRPATHADGLPTLPVIERTADRLLRPPLWAGRPREQINRVGVTHALSGAYRVVAAGPICPTHAPVARIIDIVDIEPSNRGGIRDRHRLRRLMTATWPLSRRRVLQRTVSFGVLPVVLRPAVMAHAGAVPGTTSPASPSPHSADKPTRSSACIARVVRTFPLNSLQGATQYLQRLVAAVWRVTGVSWARLAILPGLMFGAVAALTYVLLRLALSRILALGASVAALMSTPNIMLVPQLRDYSKGPFLLAVIAIMMATVMGPADRRRIIALSALAGAIVGIGFGFRTDLAIAVPPVMVTLAFLVLAGIPGGVRVAAIGVFLATFVLAAFPVLRSRSEGGNAGHVILLGLAPAFDAPLRIEPSVYEFVGQYNDTSAFSVVNSYVIRVQHRRDGVALGSAEYEDAASEYLTHLARVFPADVITRVAAAVRTVPKYFLDSSLYPPPVNSRFADLIYRVRAIVLSRLAPVAFLAVVAATLVISLVHLRAAWLAVVVMVGFAGASALQFHERHFYYLQFVPWLAFGVLVQAIVHRSAIRYPTPRQIKLAALSAVAIFTVSCAAIGASRAYQQRSVTRLFNSYEGARGTPVHAVQRRTQSGRALISSDEWLAPLPVGLPWIVSRFLAVRFHDDLCGPTDLPVTIRYSGRTPDVDLSEQVAVHLRRSPQRPTTLFIAAVDRADESIRFRGIEVASERAQCVGDLSRVEDLEATPLLLTTRLGANWRDESLFQRFH